MGAPMVAQAASKQWVGVGFGDFSRGVDFLYKYSHRQQRHALCYGVPLILRGRFFHALGRIMTVNLEMDRSY